MKRLHRAFGRVKMKNKTKQKVRIAIILTNDLIIFCLAMLESGFWSKIIDSRLTFGYFFPIYDGGNYRTADPISGVTGIDLSLPIPEGSSLGDILFTFAVGLLLFFILKCLLGLVLQKLGIFELFHRDALEHRQIFKARQRSNNFHE